MPPSHAGQNYLALRTWLTKWPLTDIPMQTIVERVARGDYHAQPAHEYEFDAIVAAHRLMESNAAGGKIVVRV